MTRRYDVVAVGASTGGPQALTRILGELPASFPAGILIAQHMPPGFTATLAQRLDRRCRLNVREAQDGDLVEPGSVLFGMGGRQMSVTREDGALRVRIANDGGELLHRPCVDYLFETVAEAVGARSVGLVLTGMGQDGARGLSAIRKAGGRTIVESEETAIIYGMPRAASPAAERTLPLERIASALQSLFEEED